MGTSLSIMIMFSLSVFIVRLATVALRLTGLSEPVAKFQALSAFSGTGYTTQESEQIVNYPVRRKIVSNLIIVGNLGLVAIFSTVVVGFVNTNGSVPAIANLLYWVAGGVAVIWFLLLNPVADKVMCRSIHRLLLSTTSLGKLSYRRLLQVGSDWSIAEHQVTLGYVKQTMTVSDVINRLSEGTVIALKRPNGDVIVGPSFNETLGPDDTLTVLAPEGCHRCFYEENQNIE